MINKLIEVLVMLIANTFLFEKIYKRTRPPIVCGDCANSWWSMSSKQRWQTQLEFVLKIISKIALN